jgi:hypothetical protein
MKFWLPEQSAGEIVALDTVEAPPVLDGIARWRQAKGTARWPAFGDGTLELLTANTILVRALIDDNGYDDYEYVSVGHALVEAFNVDFSGQRLSSIIALLPKFGLGLKMLYDMVKAGGEPIGYRGWAGQDLSGAQFVYYESAVLPLGRETVDHVLVYSALVSKDAAA